MQEKVFRRLPLRKNECRFGTDFIDQSPSLLPYSLRRIRPARVLQKGAWKDLDVKNLEVKILKVKDFDWEARLEVIEPCGKRDVP